MDDVKDEEIPPIVSGDALGQKAMRKSNLNCGQCGAGVDSGDKFCSNCGQTLTSYAYGALA